MKAHSLMTAILGLLILCPAVAGEEPKHNLVMPSELVELAENNGYTQIPDFYDSWYCTLPPFVYGSQDESNIWLERLGAAFLCRKVADSAGGEDSYYLILASRPTFYSPLEIDTVLKQYYYPRGGFELYRDTILTLDSFVYIDDGEKPGPAGVKMRHTAYRVIWDGADDIYYKHEGRWLIRRTWDW